MSRRKLWLQETAMVTSTLYVTYVYCAQELSIGLKDRK